MRTSTPMLLSLALAASSHWLCAQSGSCLPAANNTSPSSITVDHYVFDAALKRVWAIVIDCRHPEWPAQMVDAQASPFAASVEQFRGKVLLKPQALKPLVASGSRVELWREGSAQIRLSGIAVESAWLGQPVRVRTSLRGNTLRGIVRGPHSVELIETSRTAWGEP